MKLADYQREAARTAQPAAYDRDYLVPMIVGELGELFGQRAKSVWHGWSPARLKAELTLEYGDIAWGTAILLDLEGWADVDGVVPQPSRSVWGTHLDPWHQLLNKATGLHLFYTSPDNTRFLPQEARVLWVLLERHCEAITGSTWDEVLQANLAKLASRAARGVLQGAGDHR